MFNQLENDESTNVQSCSQLMIYTRYVHSGDLKKQFIFGDDLELTTKGKDVMAKLSEFFETDSLDRCNLCGVPAKLGSRSRFVTLTK